MNIWPTPFGAVEHRHGDEWYPMEDRTPADPEREWARHRIFYCSRCAEEIRVEVPEGHERDAGRG